MKPIASEAELSDALLPISSAGSSHPILKPVPDEPAFISVFPTGHTVLDHQIHNFHRWAEKKLHSPVGQYMMFPQLGAITHAKPQRAEENGQTLLLYKDVFSSFFWTGIECSNPQSPQGERWDQLDLTGVYDARHRRQQIRLMCKAGIENVRLGMPNHKMVEQKSWRCFDKVLSDFKNAGIKVSLDLQHFGLPDHLRDHENPEESIYLNPKWPEHYLKFSMRAVKKYWNQLEAITLVNEPLITNRFSSCFWNEAMPGDMSHDRYNHYFIKRALLISWAAVQARYEIQRFMQTQQKDRMIFIHNESCERHAENSEFNHFGRFLGSDLILGQEWLLNGDFTETDIFQWMRGHYIRPGHEAADEQKLIAQLDQIRQHHLNFQNEFGKSMKADTVFGVDYYAACETVNVVHGFPKPTCVNTYTEQVESGQRLGLAGICVEYWNRYQLPILHTETNFVDFDQANHGGEWGVKQLIELAQLPKFGIPVLGFTWYSLMDQFNWHNGLQGSPKENVLHPVGLYSWPEYEPRAFTREVLTPLMQVLSQPAHHHHKAAPVTLS